jgi:hypothetical protein
MKKEEIKLESFTSFIAKLSISKRFDFDFDKVKEFYVARTKEGKERNDHLTELYLIFKTLGFQAPDKFL